MKVAESLKRIRKAHKLTQQDIATVLGIDRTTYTLYETGVTSPSVETLVKLSNMYNATIGYILGKEENNHADRLGKSYWTVDEEDIDPIAFLPKDEQKLILAYRLLSKEYKEKLCKDAIEALKNEQK